MCIYLYISGWKSRIARHISLAGSLLGGRFVENGGHYNTRPLLTPFCDLPQSSLSRTCPISASISTYIDTRWSTQKHEMPIYMQTYLLFLSRPPTGSCSFSEKYKSLFIIAAGSSSFDPAVTKKKIYKPPNRKVYIMCERWIALLAKSVWLFWVVGNFDTGSPAETNRGKSASRHRVNICLSAQPIIPLRLKHSPWNIINTIEMSDGNLIQDDTNWQWPPVVNVHLKICHSRATFNSQLNETENKFIYEFDPKYILHLIFRPFGDI